MHLHRFVALTLLSVTLSGTSAFASEPVNAHPKGSIRCFTSGPELVSEQTAQESSDFVNASALDSSTTVQLDYLALGNISKGQNQSVGTQANRSQDKNTIKPIIAGACGECSSDGDSGYWVGSTCIPCRH